MTKQPKQTKIKRTVSRSRRAKACVEVFESTKDDFYVSAVFYGRTRSEALWRADEYTNYVNRAHVTTRRMWSTGWRKFWSWVHIRAVAQADWLVDHPEEKPTILQPVLAWLSDFILHPGRQVK